MGVYIKDMRMPENCEKCPFLIEEDVDFGICRQCGAGKSGYIHEADIDGFPADCPLVDLGKHGRLIDVDAFKTDYGMKDDCADCEKECRGKVKACEYDRIYSKMDFCNWIDDSPTVIEAEDGT